MRVGLLFCLALVLAMVRAEQVALTNGTATCSIDTLGARVISCRINGDRKSVV